MLSLVPLSFVHGRLSTDSFVLTRNGAVERPQFVQKTLCLLLGGRLAVPAVIKFYFRYSLPRNGVRDNERRLLIYRLRLLHRVNEHIYIVTVHFKHVPVECFVLRAQVFKRHYALRHAVYLYVV